MKRSTESSTLRLATDPASVPRARRHAAQALTDWGLVAHQDAVTLAVSELVTNAIRHAIPPLSMTLARHDASVLVTVLDGDRTAPHLPDRKPNADDAEGGRGLSLLAAVSDEWGWDLRKDGKAVWCRVTTHGHRPGAAGPHPQPVRR